MKKAREIWNEDWKGFEEGTESGMGKTPQRMA